MCVCVCVCFTVRTRKVQAELCMQYGHACICESFLAISLSLRTTVLSDSRKEAALLGGAGNLGTKGS